MASIRTAKPGEGASLTALCVRSKAHWGYDAAFMRKCAAALLVSEAEIAAGRVLVACDATGRTIGVAGVAPEGETADLDVLFVDPPAIGSGARPPVRRATPDDPGGSQRRGLLRAHGRALCAQRAVRRHSRPHPAAL